MAQSKSQPIYDVKLINPEKGELEIRMGETTLKGRLSIDDLESLDFALAKRGGTIFELGLRLGDMKANVDELVLVLQTALNGARADGDPELDARKLIHDFGLLPSYNAIHLAFVSAMTPGNAPRGKAKAEAA